MLMLTLMSMLILREYGNLIDFPIVSLLTSRLHPRRFKNYQSMPLARCQSP